MNGLPPDVPGSASADSDVEALAPPSAAALPAPEAISDDLQVDLPDEDDDQDVDQGEVEALADGPAPGSRFEVEAREDSLSSLG